MTQSPLIPSSDSEGESCDNVKVVSSGVKRRAGGDIVPTGIRHYRSVSMDSGFMGKLDFGGDASSSLKLQRVKFQRHEEKTPLNLYITKSSYLYISLMGGLIDLNVTEEEEEEETLSSASGSLSPSNSSSSAFALSGSSGVCLELWHACAGPLVSLPKRGSFVLYFPQGHLEQAPDFSAVIYGLPPHVFCRILDVKLHAERDSDEVYAQVSLLPESEDIERKVREGVVDVDGGEEDYEVFKRSNTPHMFCKTLTASDTSTHGGFSVPRRAAEDCFPPLDCSQPRPSQELLARDLHGLELCFRHIYRVGQPRKHLLTTGWSAFVNKKKLVSGDAVLFLRGDDGKLRLGVRRAAQFEGASAFSIQ
ncbi:unnamed protein product [Eruca vesicaria subsp. sativa]|uniref:TF-B3 domain-containing protein n=1 Tax=Eruca vesicaria subsp. sativa TaxID=29727 RepID=A0ABC8J139_ERUVS|nr:unnamed protein product [Eruca vesicaria subsp. sativa]